MNNNLPDYLIIPSVLIEDDDLQPIDGYVYGVIYWYTKLKLEKCIASNEKIAQLINVKNPRSISNSLTRLKRKGYIDVIMNLHTNQRIEIWPLITFSKKEDAELLPNPSSNDEGGFIKNDRGGSSNDEQNNNNLIKRINNTISANGNLRKLQDSTTNKDLINVLEEYLVQHFHDESSRSYFRLVASKIPESIFRTWLSEIKVDGAQNPIKVFIYRAEKYAQAHLQI